MKMAEGIIVIILLTLALAFFAFGKGYKFGQIRALTGNVKYELQTQSNGETVWKYMGMKKGGMK